MALMITDVLVADHQRHEVTMIANAFVEDGGIDEAYARAAETIAEVREKLRSPSRRRARAYPEAKLTGHSDRDRFPSRT